MVANVQKIASAEAAVRYVTGMELNQAMSDDYFRTENIGHAGKWNDPDGILKRFGINDGDIIDPKHLLNLLKGKHPDTGKDLFKEVEGKTHMPGTEIENSVPKEVSAIYAIADQALRDAIDQAIIEANNDSLNFVRNEATFTRLGKGGMYHEHASFVAASYNHGSSRGAENDLGGDPHRHIHNLTLNITEYNGKLMKLENKYMLEHTKAIGAQFRASLARKFQALGFDIERNEDNGTFKIPGIPTELIKHWSSRREGMLAAAAEQGLSTQNQANMRDLQIETKRAKIVIDIDELIGRWSHEAKERGFTQESIE
ncbi:MAG: MobF family relaxase, partial [Oscillospiraceae bacterium]